MKVELPFLPESTEWLASLRTDGKSASTLQCYARDLRHISIAINNNETSFLAAVDQLVVENIAKCWSTNAASAGTIERRFSTLRGFARFLLRNKFFDCSRILSLEYPTVTRTYRPILCRDDIDLIVAPSSLTQNWRSLRDIAALRLQAHNGLTVAEAASLTVTDVNGDFLHVRTTRLRSRMIKLDAETARLIRQYVRDRAVRACPKNGPLFVNERGNRLSRRSLQLIFWRRRLECGLKSFNRRSCLRRSLGVQLAAQEHAPKEIADILGIGAISAYRLFS